MTAGHGQGCRGPGVISLLPICAHVLRREHSEEDKEKKREDIKRQKTKVKEWKRARDIEVEENERYTGLEDNK